MITLNLKVAKRRDVLWSRWVFCLMPPPSLSKSHCSMNWSRALGRCKMKRLFGFLLTWLLLQLFSHMGACQLKKRESVKEGELLGNGRTASSMTVLVYVDRRQCWNCEKGLLSPSAVKHGAVQTWLYTVQDVILATSHRCALYLSERKIYTPDHLKLCYCFKINGHSCIWSQVKLSYKLTPMVLFWRVYVT